MVATFIVVFSDAFGISLVDTPMVGVGEAGTKTAEKKHGDSRILEIKVRMIYFRSFDSCGHKKLY
jgi:hypothetical protein